MNALYVRRIGILSAAKFGCVTGMVSAAPVGIVLAFLVHTLLGVLRRTMEGWQNASIDVRLLGKIPVNLIQLLKLGDALEIVRRLDDLPWVVVAGVFVGVMLAMGLLSAVFASWLALAYNSVAAFSGGLEMTLEPGRDTHLIVMRRNTN